MSGGAAALLIVGSGLAGLSAALRMAENRPQSKILLITKTESLPGGSSAMAQGGIAAAIGADDAPELHAGDSLAAADGLADATVVESLTAAGPATIHELTLLGARFDRDDSGALALGREAAHRHPRIVHAAGDATGAELVRALVAAVVAHPAIEAHCATFAHGLIVDGGHIVGVRAFEPLGRPIVMHADHVLLATGGSGQLYSATTNPKAATGDGLAMAARAGAMLADVEFVQFHPTALNVAGVDPLPLITEALRGAGALLVDERGRRFMPDVHPQAELAPRDAVARAIRVRLDDGGRIFLDASNIGADIPSRFPTVFNLCLAFGLDPRRDLLPVIPAAHYHMGGVMVDDHGATSLPGLWAAGEVATTGAHGANRLASNSLLEAVVYGQRVADAVVAGHQSRGDRWSSRESMSSPGTAGTCDSARPGDIAATSDTVGTGDSARPDDSTRPDDGAWRAATTWTAAVYDSQEPVDLLEARRAIRDLAWRHVGLLRDAGGLATALDEFEALGQRLARDVGSSIDATEVANLALVGRLVATAALRRAESRGAHIRLDHPHTMDDCRRRIHLRFDADEIEVTLGQLLAP